MTSEIHRTLHLVDDLRLGGVTRFLTRLRALRPQDRIVEIERSAWGARRHPAETLVSHLAISWRGAPALIALRACNPKARLLHVEHSYCEGFFQRKVKNRERFLTLLRSAYALCDAVICVSEAQAAWILHEGLAPLPKLRVASPIVDLAPFFALGAPRPSRHLRYGFVGRLCEQKGLEQALSAWRMVSPPGARLTIFGDGPARGALQAIAADDPSIVFRGATDDPARAYEEIDVAIMPSLWEPYGLSCLEARAAGRPVLAARVDGLPEQLHQGAGALIDPTPVAWIEAFALERARAPLEAMGQIGRASARADQARAEAAWRTIAPQDVAMAAL